MRADKSEAFHLRREGKSYNEIAATLKVAKSTLSLWFRGHDFSDEIKQNLTKKIELMGAARLQVLNKIRGDLLQAHYAEALKQAQAELQKYSYDPLFVSGVVAYWGEGDKTTPSIVRLANTDPQMITLFIQFLFTYCDVPEEKIRGALYIYEDLDEATCKDYWSKHTGLQYFHKTMVLPSRHKTKRLPYGTCTVLVSNTYLKRKLLLWIDQLPQIVLNMSAAKKS
jgi:hypothetical protein